MAALVGACPSRKGRTPRVAASTSPGEEGANGLRMGLGSWKGTAANQIAAGHRMDCILAAEVDPARMDSVRCIVNTGSSGRSTITSAINPPFSLVRQNSRWDIET